MAVMLNVADGTTTNGEVDVALVPPAKTVTGPVAAPAGIANDSDVVEEAVSGGLILPVPSWAIITCGAVPNLFPDTDTSVPTGPVLGLKSEIVGPFPEVTPKPFGSEACSAA